MLTTRISSTINMQTLPFYVSTFPKILFEEFLLHIDKISISSKKLITFVEIKETKEKQSKERKSSKHSKVT